MLVVKSDESVVAHDDKKNQWFFYPTKYKPEMPFPVPNVKSNISRSEALIRSAVAQSPWDDGTVLLLDDDIVLQNFSDRKLGSKKETCPTFVATIENFLNDHPKDKDVFKLLSEMAAMSYWGFHSHEHQNSFIEGEHRPTSGAPDTLPFPESYKPPTENINTLPSYDKFKACFYYQKSVIDYIFEYLPEIYTITSPLIVTGKMSTDVRLVEKIYNAINGCSLIYKVRNPNDVSIGILCQGFTQMPKNPFKGLTSVALPNIADIPEKDITEIPWDQKLPVFGDQQYSPMGIMIGNMEIGVGTSRGIIFPSTYSAIKHIKKFWWNDVVSLLEKNSCKDTPDIHYDKFLMPIRPHTTINGVPFSNIQRNWSADFKAVCSHIPFIPFAGDPMSQFL